MTANPRQDYATDTNGYRMVANRVVPAYNVASRFTNIIPSMAQDLANFRYIFPTGVATKQANLDDGLERAHRVVDDPFDGDVRIHFAAWLAEYFHQEDQLWSLSQDNLPAQAPAQNGSGSAFLSQDAETQAAVMAADLTTPNVIAIERPFVGTVTHAEVIDPNTLPDNEHDRICSICTEELHARRHPPVRLDCGHTFGFRCIRTWLQNSNQCPMCRDEKFAELNHGEADVEEVGLNEEEGAEVEEDEESSDGDPVSESDDEDEIQWLDELEAVNQGMDALRM